MTTSSQPASAGVSAKIEWGRRLKRVLLFIGGVALFFLVVVADFETGPNLSAAIFYLFPIVYFGFLISGGWGAVFSVLSVAAWLVSDLSTGLTPPGSTIPYWNAAAQLAMFLATAYAAVKSRQEIHKLREDKRSLARFGQEMIELSARNVEFASTVSHELRTPMATIKESLKLLDDKAGQTLGPESRHYLSMARKNIERLIRFTNNVLDYIRLEENKRQLAMAPQNLAPLLAEAVELHRLLAAQKGLELKCSPEIPDCTVRCDPDAILQVLGNLLANAIKFTDQGSITVAARLDAGRAVVSVADTGRGIEKSFLPSLFQPFQSQGRGGSDANRGAGLGLVISKKIVEAHQGRIQVESEQGRGTTVSIELPICKPPSTNPHPKEPAL